MYWLITIWFDMIPIFSLIKYWDIFFTYYTQFENRYFEDAKKRENKFTHNQQNSNDTFVI